MELSLEGSKNYDGASQSISASDDTDRRLHFLGLNESAREMLRDFWGRLEPQLPDILDAFYHHVATEPGLNSLIGANEERLKAAQTGHWQRLFEGRFDEAYFDGAHKIGMAHNRIGLEPRWYIGGYNFVLGRLLALAAEHYGNGDMESLNRVQKTVCAAVLLDVDIAVTVYQEALLAEQEAREKHLNTEIRSFDNSAREEFNGLSEAGTRLAATASQLKSASASMTSEAAEVSSAANEASENVQSVASSSEELSASISEISRQVQQSSEHSRNAVDAAREAGNEIGKLSQTAEEIGTVVGLINDIAAQTKLLSLNATIEAARAGDAGRGFGVVASEVKNLANQTEQATRDIEKQVAAIQNATRTAVDTIEKVNTIIQKFDGVASTISAAVEEQSATTSQIAQAIQQAATGTSQVSERIVRVSEASAETDTAAESVITASEEVKSHSARMRESLTAFFDRVKAE